MVFEDEFMTHNDDDADDLGDLDQSADRNALSKIRDCSHFYHGSNQLRLILLLHTYRGHHGPRNPANVSHLPHIPSRSWKNDLLQRNQSQTRRICVDCMNSPLVYMLHEPTNTKQIVNSGIYKIGDFI